MKTIFIRKLLLMVIVLLILVNCFEPNIYSGIIVKKENHPLISETHNKITYVNSLPITILNDTAFSINYGFSGDGSSATPYLIQNFNISGIFPYGIFIYNTTKHFIIQDCNIESVDYGIFALNVTPSTGQIKSNIISNTTSYGIGLTNANGTVIFNNTITKNWNNAFGVDWSNNVTVQQNLVSLNNGTGGQFNRSQDNFVFNNTFVNNSLSGLDFYNTSTSLIYNNTICNSTNGLTLNTYLTKLNVIYYNRFINNTFSAWDFGRQNLFYNSTSYQGNYWSDNFGIPYFISGTDNTRDYFPLDSNMNPLAITTTTTLPSTGTTTTVTVTENMTTTEMLTTTQNFTVQTTVTTTQNVTVTKTVTTNGTSTIQSLFLLLNKTITTTTNATATTTSTTATSLSIIGVTGAIISVTIFVNRRRHKED